jgi:hypothetical protein
MSGIERVRILDKIIPFEVLFQIYAIIAIPFLCLELFLLFGMNIGVAGYIFDPEYSVLYRVSFLLRSFSIVAFLPLIVQTSATRTRIFAILLLVCGVALGIGQTSKGVFLTLFIAFLVCMHFAGRKIHARHMFYGGGIIIAVMALYIPVILTIRGTILQGISWSELPIIGICGTFQTYSDALLLMSRRLGGLDWLVGFMTVGRDAFPDYVGLRGDSILVLNSFVPGEIISQHGWVSVAYLIPFLLRGFRPPIEGSIAAHGESFGLLGMGYVYFGWVGGVLLLFVWTVFSTWVFASRIGRIYKILYFYYFVVVFFIGGGFSTPVLRIYESFISLGVVYALYTLRYEIIAYAVGKPRLSLPEPTVSQRI